MLEKEVHNISKKRLAESDQASRLNYKFIRNTRDRGTCKMTS